MKAFIIAVAIFAGLGVHDWSIWKKHPGDKSGSRGTSEAFILKICQQEMAIDLSLCMAAKVNPWANITYAQLPLILK